MKAAKRAILAGILICLSFSSFLNVAPVVCIHDYAFVSFLLSLVLGFKKTDESLLQESTAGILVH